MAKTQKQKAWRWCAKYIKLRDAIEDLLVTKDISLVRCRACGKWLKTNSKEAQASHYFSRGAGGSSGVYFDERNIHICCYQCNCFRQGNMMAYREFMLEKYGQDVLDDLEFRHRNKIYQQKDFIGFELYYKQEFERLKDEVK